MRDLHVISKGLWIFPGIRLNGTHLQNWPWKCVVLHHSRWNRDSNKRESKSSILSENSVELNKRRAQNTHKKINSRSLFFNHCRSFFSQSLAWHDFHFPPARYFFCLVYVFLWFQDFSHCNVRGYCTFSEFSKVRMPPDIQSLTPAL